MRRCCSAGEIHGSQQEQAEAMGAARILVCSIAPMSLRQMLKRTLLLGPAHVWWGMYLKCAQWSVPCRKRNASAHCVLGTKLVDLIYAHYIFTTGLASIIMRPLQYCPVGHPQVLRPWLFCRFSSARGTLVKDPF